MIISVPPPPTLLSTCRCKDNLVGMDDKFELFTAFLGDTVFIPLEIFFVFETNKMCSM